MDSGKSDDKKAETHRSLSPRVKKLIVIILVIVICFALFFFKFCRIHGEDIMDRFQRPGKLAHQREPETGKSGTFSVSINSEIYLKEDGTGAAYIKNLKENGCNMQVVIRDKETRSLLYQSDVLKVGSHIDMINIDRKQIKKGKNVAVAEFFAIDEETGKVQNQVSVDILIVATD